MSGSCLGSRSPLPSFTRLLGRGWRRESELLRTDLLGEMSVGSSINRTNVAKIEFEMCGRKRTNSETRSCWETIYEYHPNPDVFAALLYSRRRNPQFRCIAEEAIFIILHFLYNLFFHIKKNITALSVLSRESIRTHRSSCL